MRIVSGRRDKFNIRNPSLNVIRLINRRSKQCDRDFRLQDFRDTWAALLRGIWLYPLLSAYSLHSKVGP